MSTSLDRSASIDGGRRRQAAVRSSCLAPLRWMLIVAALVWGWPSRAHTQPATLPQPAPLPSYSPLCDSNLVPCLDIDDLAAHAYAHLLILPATELRGTAVAIPYGLALGLFGRVAGGVSTSYTLWRQGDALISGHSPLRVSGTVLLWPLFPLHLRPERSAAPTSTGEPHFIPPRPFRIGITYDHELRVGPFDGANSLGLYTDLSALRLVAVKALGPIELTLSLGALIEPQRKFATGEAAAQVSLYLPFFKAVRVSAEVLGRGVPSFVHPDLSAVLDGSPLHAQGVLGLALSYRPHARIDLGVSAQMGFGGLAPSAVIVRFVVLSIGKTYDGRGATPLTQLAVDAAAYAAAVAVAKLKEYIASLPIDPQLDENCIIRDHDGSYMGRFGTRTADRRNCEQDGFRVPIDYELLRDRAGDRLCRDSRKNLRTGKRDLYDCVLWRHGKQWFPAYQARLNGKCELRDGDGKLIGQLGSPSNDGVHCRYPVQRANGNYGAYTDYQEQRIGEIFYTDAARGTICENPNLTNCIVEPAEGRTTLRMTPMERLARGVDRSVRRKAEGLQAAAQAGEDVAAGKVSVTTIGNEVRKEALEVARTVTDPDKLKAAAQEKTEQWAKSVSDWLNEPPDDQLDDAAEWATSAAVDAAAGALTGAAGRAAGNLVEAAGGMRKLRKASKAEKAARVTKHPRSAPRVEAAGHGPHVPAPQPALPDHLNTPDNVARMKKGNAPRDPEGRPIELHHDGQQADSQLVPLTRDEHRGGENFKKNHPNTGQEPSKIDRKEFDRQRREFWKNHASKIKPE